MKRHVFPAAIVQAVTGTGMSGGRSATLSVALNDEKEYSIP